MVGSRTAHHLVIMRELLTHGGMSRAALQRQTGLRANTVIEVVDAMRLAGWVTDAGTVDADQRLGGEARGRPAVRVEVDAAQRSVVGLALMPGRAEAIRLNLRGEPVGEPAVIEFKTSNRLTESGAALLRQVCNPRVLAVGVSSPGLIDESAMKLLFSSSAPQLPGLSLQSLLDAAGALPVALENDTHALGDRWRIAEAHPPEHPPGQTVLLIKLADGQIGASLMTGGGPADGGCVRGANELGHVQVPAPGCAIPACYCGQQRCLERLFSSAMVRRLTGTRRSLATVLASDNKAPLPAGRGGSNSGGDSGGASGGDSGGEVILDGLAEAVANAVNLLRPHQVVWVADDALLDSRPRWMDALSAKVTCRMLPVLRDRVTLVAWNTRSDHRHESPAVTAGHLALALLTGRREPSVGSMELLPRKSVA